jgi:hypothetical protein
MLALDLSLLLQLASKSPGAPPQIKHIELAQAENRAIWDAADTQKRLNSSATDPVARHVCTLWLEYLCVVDPFLWLEICVWSTLFCGLEICVWSTLFCGLEICVWSTLFYGVEICVWSTLLLHSPPRQKK